MHYSSEQHEEIDEGMDDLSRVIHSRWVSLASDVAPLLKQELAREHILHGAARRLRIIEQCLKNIFEIYPVRRTQLLGDEERSDLELNLHSFLIHIHGVPDNLAWVFLIERKIPLKPFQIGLFREETQEHLPADVVKYLTSEPISSWHWNYAKDYRDALAHRIPPYVPPATYTPAHEEEIRELEKRREQAIEDSDSELALQLEAAKYEVGIICPAFMHSFSDEDAIGPIVLHPQMIADARTVIEIIGVVVPYLSLPKD